MTDKVVHRVIDNSLVLVCVRIADLNWPPVPSLPRICDGCGYRVWVSLTSPTVERILCRQCAMDEMAPGEPIHMTPETMAEVNAVLRKKLS